jgi:hypothetical protein|tara:strand:- start:443 stop:2062 length:1620 start_codon:yes stop_codon:yes gene_type:complete
MRITEDFASLLSDCNGIMNTKTASLLLHLSEGSIVENNLLKGDIPMFLSKSITEIGKVSYATSNRIEYYSWSDEDASDLSNEKRMKAKVGKTIKKIFTSSFLDEYYGDKFNNDVELFTSQLKSKFHEDNESHLYETANVNKSYHWTRTSADTQEGCGSLGESCMRSDECVEGDYMELYDWSDTPVHLLCADAGEGIYARALLWSIEGKTYMDRIYETHDGDMDVFKSYAKKKGWIYKERQSYSAKTTWIVDGEVQTIPLIVPCADLDNLDRFPYVDTFTFGFIDVDGNSYLTNDIKYAHEIHRVTEFRKFESTSGNYDCREYVVVHFISDDGLTTYSGLDINEDYVNIETSSNMSPTIQKIYNAWALMNPNDTYFRLSRLDEGKNRRIVHRIRDNHGNRMWVHESETITCEYSDTMFIKGSDDFINVMHRGRAILASPRFFIKDREGILRAKNDCTWYIDADGKQQIVNTVDVPRDAYETTKDWFGVKRLQSDCTYIKGYADCWILNTNVQLIKSMQLRTEESNVIAGEIDSYILSTNN